LTYGKMEDNLLRSSSTSYHNPSSKNVRSFTRCAELTGLHVQFWRRDLHISRCPIRQLTMDEVLNYMTKIVEWVGKLFYDLFHKKAFLNFTNLFYSCNRGV